jgi:sporulation-control protein spo0M
MMKDFKKSSLADVACFDKTLARLESDIDAMRVRANAWAKGDIEAIQKLSYPDQESECNNAMLGAEFVKNRAASRTSRNGYTRG